MEAARLCPSPRSRTTTAIWSLTWTSGLCGVRGCPQLPRHCVYADVLLDTTPAVHHLGHHQTYTDKLNAALTELRANSSTKHLAKLGIDTLLTRLNEVPENLRTAIQNK